MEEVSLPVAWPDWSGRNSCCCLVGGTGVSGDTGGTGFTGTPVCPGWLAGGVRNEVGRLNGDVTTGGWPAGFVRGGTSGFVAGALMKVETSSCEGESKVLCSDVLPGIVK